MNAINRELTLSLPGSLDYLPVAVGFVRESVHAFGANQEDVDKLQLASEESFSNIIKHSLKENPDEIFTVKCRDLSNSIEILIHDKGMPFSPEELPEFDPQKILENQEFEGLGLYLIRNAVDKVVFKNLGRNGHETVLIKYKQSKHINNIADTSNQDKNIIKSLDKWSIRNFIPSDALEISRCAYSTYGYTYEPYIYYPDKIIDMNASGELKSLVAISDDGILLAHMALKFYHPDDPVAEIGVAFVNPDYRRHGIFAKLNDHQLDTARKSGISGIYGRAVTSHFYSQKMLTKSEFISCGIMLGLFPSDVDFKKLGGKIVQKESALLSFLPYESKNEVQLFAPGKHQDMINQIFTKLGLSFKFTSDEKRVENPSNNDSAIDGQLQLTYSKMEVFNTADILCFASDDSVIKNIKAAKEKLCLEHTDALYLFLDLEQEGTPKLVSQCEELGFFFAGVLPFGLHGHHALILQYLNNLQIDFEKIELFDPFSNEIAEYIEKCHKEK